MNNGKLVACRRIGRDRALAAAAALVAPAPALTRRLAQLSLAHAIMARTRGERALDPLIITVDMVSVSTALSLSREWQRDAGDASRLVIVFRDDAHLDALVGLLAWHAPISKESHGYYKICVPPPSPRVALGDSMVRLSRTRKAMINFMAYETATQRLTLHLSVARFNASKRVRGADVREPIPTHLSDVACKYVLSKGWVPVSTHAPTAGELRRAYPGRLDWSLPTAV